MPCVCGTGSRSRAAWDTEQGVGRGEAGVLLEVGEAAARKSLDCALTTQLLVVPSLGGIGHAFTEGCRTRVHWEAPGMEGDAPSTCGQGVKSYLQLCWFGEGLCVPAAARLHCKYDIVPLPRRTQHRPQVCGHWTLLPLARV